MLVSSASNLHQQKLADGEDQWRGTEGGNLLRKCDPLDQFPLPASPERITQDQ